MIPVLYEAETTSFVKNGIGRLNDCISCLVTEERNGLYEVEFSYPLTGIHYADIQLGRIISCTHDETGYRQPFRIYRRSDPIDGIVTFNARHIAYDLQNVIVKPFTASSCTLALQGFVTNAITPCPFTFWTDKSVSATFTVDHPVSVWEMLGGTQGSILDVYGTGEYEFDGWTVKLHLNRGANNGVVVRYGKNLTDLTREIEQDGLFNAIIPYWKGPDGTLVTGSIVSNPGLLHHAYWTDQDDVNIEDSNGNWFEFDYYQMQLVPMDFTEQFENQPTAAQLNTAASAYLTNNTPWVPKENLTFDFVALWQTEEYKDYAFLQRVKLCDTVRVVYPDLGVDTTAKVVRVVYNVILDRYDEIEIGSPKATYASLIQKSSVDQSTEAMQDALVAYHASFEDEMDAAIQNATELITGGLGGHVVFGMDANGKPQEIYIMDTEDVSTAVKVFRMNVNGMGFSSTGINGTYRTAWTFSDAAFVADFITAGTLTANLLKAGTIQGTGDNNYWDLVNGILSAQKGYVGGFTIANNKLTATSGYNTFELSPEDGIINGYNDRVYGQLYSKLDNSQIEFKDANNNYTRFRPDAPGLTIYGVYDGEWSCTFLGFYLHSYGDYVTRIGQDRVFIDYDNVFCTASASTGNFNILTGGFICLGNKSRAVKTDEFATRLLYCYETPSPMFGDVGEGVIDEDGTCYIWLDPVFAETIQTSQYQVFLQEYGDGRCYVSERHPTYFVVKGTAGMAFGWELKAKQKGNDVERLEIYDTEQPQKCRDFGEAASNYVKNLMEERMI